MKNNAKIVALFITVSVRIFSQNMPLEQKLPPPKLTDHLFWGGEIGLQFGTITFINISPLIGYKITKYLSIGAGPKYLYYKYKDPALVYTTSMYGGRVFTRYNITQTIFAHAEYEVLNLETYFKQRQNVESIFIGGGFRQRIGEKAYLAVYGLWNIRQSIYSPYTNPLIRMEFISAW